MNPLEALLGGMHGGGPQGPPPGQPASIQVDPNQGAEQGESPQGEQKAMSLLKQMITLGQQYVQVEPDDVDKHTMMKVLAQLQQYLAKDQQEAEKAMGSSPAVKSLARATRSGA